MMTKVELETFVEGTTHYFATAANQPASVGSPYIVQEGRPAIQEFTGVINIAGKRRGIVYFTASRPMLTVMLMRMGETELTQENMCDLVGEVANTISGNARRDFGKDFMISVPTVVAGEPEKVVAGALVRHELKVAVLIAVANALLEQIDHLFGSHQPHDAPDLHSRTQTELNAGHDAEEAVAADGQPKQFWMLRARAVTQVS